MTGVYILFLPFPTRPVALLSAFGWRSRYAGIPLLLWVLLFPAIGSASDVDTFGNQEFRTETGEQRPVALGGDSKAFLDAESALRVSFEPVASKVYLEAGQAAFELVRDPRRAFTVHVSDATIHAEGSHFHVRRKTDRTVVSVLAGEVRVVSLAGDARVAAPKSRFPRTRGWQFIIFANGTLSKPADVSVTQIVAWRERRIAFHNLSLAEIAEEFNRYNKSPKLRVVGPVLKARVYSGMIDADDPQALLDYLSSDNRIEFDRDTPDWIIIRFRSRYGFAGLGAESGHPLSFARGDWDTH